MKTKNHDRDLRSAIVFAALFLIASLIIGESFATVHVAFFGSFFFAFFGFYLLMAYSLRIETKKIENKINSISKDGKISSEKDKKDKRKTWGWGCSSGILFVIGALSGATVPSPRMGIMFFSFFCGLSLAFIGLLHGLVRLQDLYHRSLEGHFQNNTEEDRERP